MKDFILAVDAGTTSSRAIIFDRNGTTIGTSQHEFTQHFPKESWVEHNALEIWDTQLLAIREVLEKTDTKASQIHAIGITNQRETTVLWNRSTGKPVHKAIVWQDRRTAFICDELKKSGKASVFYEKTGLLLDAYFSGTKVKWILDHVPGAREKAVKGDLLMGTIDAWLVWNFTKGAQHITDVTNASRTLLFNINTMTWDAELLALFDIPAQMLPEVKESSEIYGHTSLGGSDHKIPIAGIAGDQQAALFGQMCTQSGMVKNTYGTGCFMLMNIGDTPIVSQNNLLTTVAWKIKGKTTYALEGSVFIAGAVVQWLRDGLKMIDQSSEVEALAATVDHTDGVYFVPAFTGLGAPYWDQHAKGTLFGLTRGSTNAHIARASLESIAFQTMDMLKAMEADAKISIKELRVDGGATVNNLLMQFQSDVLNTKTVRPQIVETTAMGAAFLAGLAVGYWTDFKEIESIWTTDKTFSPSTDRPPINTHIKGWEKAIKALTYWTSIN